MDDRIISRYEFAKQRQNRHRLTVPLRDDQRRWANVGADKQLADALQVSPTSLIVTETAVTDAEAAVEAAVGIDDSLPRRIGATLVTVEGPIPISALCEVLRASRDEIEEAVRRLDVQLAPAGMNAYRGDDSVSLVPAAKTAVAPPALKTPIRRALSRRANNQRRVRILHQTLVGKATAKKVEADTHGRISLRALVNAGLVERPGNDIEPLRLSADVRASLFLDEYPDENPEPAVDPAPIVADEARASLHHLQDDARHDT